MARKAGHPERGAMFSVEESDLKASFCRTKKICSVIRASFIVATVLYGASWLVSLVTLILFGGGMGIDVVVAPFVYTVVRGALVIACLITMVTLFADVVRGEAVFSERQANRLRLVALLLLMLVLTELAFTAQLAYEIIPGTGYGFGINDAYPTDSINLNVGMLAFSAIMYSLSALFRYAALLQQLSDDTV